MSDGCTCPLVDNKIDGSCPACTAYAQRRQAVWGNYIPEEKATLEAEYRRQYDEYKRRKRNG